MTDRVFFRIYSEIYCTNPAEPCKLAKDFDMWSLIWEKDDPNFDKEEFKNRPKDASTDLSTDLSKDLSTDTSKDISTSPTAGGGRRLQ